MDQDLSVYLQPAPGIESDNPEIIALVEGITAGADGEMEKAARIFQYARDQVRYDMYQPFWAPEHYLASATLKRGAGYCVQKAVLLCTLARAAGIAARICFADIENHQAPDMVAQAMGSRVFFHHSYVEWHLDGKWYKATPAFDAKLCQDKGWPVVEFAPGQDGLLAPVTAGGEPYIDYVGQHGCRAGLDLDEVMDAWTRGYGGDIMVYFKSMVKDGGSL